MESSTLEDALSQESGKRNRISPRTNAFNEVLALIDAQMSGWKDDRVQEALTELRQQVVGMIGTQHEVVKPATTGRTRAPKGQGKPEGTHYVGLTQSGTLTYMPSPDMALNVGNYPEFSHIWGPFNTEAGARYAMEHDTHTSKPQVF